MGGGEGNNMMACAAAYRQRGKKEGQVSCWKNELFLEVSEPLGLFLFGLSSSISSANQSRPN